MPGGLRALVEQAIGRLAITRSLRRWRGLLYRVRDGYRAKFGETGQIDGQFHATWPLNGQLAK